MKVYQGLKDRKGSVEGEKRPRRKLKYLNWAKAERHKDHAKDWHTKGRVMGSGSGIELSVTTYSGWKRTK